MAEPVVAVEGLVKRYGGTTAVDDITFEVHRGEIFALLGPNGAGKTTTVEIMESVRDPTAGSVSVLGHRISEPSEAMEVKKRIGVLPQAFNTLGRLTVEENLKFFAGMYESSVDVGGLLKLFDIEGSRRTRFADLSGGLKQRVGVAAALVNDPELLFLDEPTTGLDPEIRRATWKILSDLRAKGKTIVLTTHYMEEAEHLADRIAIMVKGKVAAIDSPGALVKRYGGGSTIVFRGGGDAVFGTLRRYFDHVGMEGSDVVLPFEQSRDIQVAMTALVERGLQADVTIRSANIEEVFLRLSGFRISETGEAK